MVKADPTRNYYADLEISANADENEIRKAFRKLALIYHPDRNPGKESEVLTKFQAIQAAHEVLSDQTQRLKYDNDRKKYRNLNIPPYNPPRARPPPPPRNVYTTSTPQGSFYRPPPPRPPPTRPPPPQHHTTFTTGADRFTSKNFRAPPTAPRPDPRPKDAEARANVFSAWQKMKQPRAEEAHQNTPNTGFSRSKSTRVPSSKKGFDPATPGGDEPQARSAYRSNYERPVPPPPPLPVDPLKQFKDQMNGESVPNVPYSEGNRYRTPYSSVKGERTSMYGEGLGRSASVRNSPTSRPASSENGGFYSDSGHRTRKSFNGNATKPFAGMYSSSDESDVEEIPAASFKTRKGGTSQKTPHSQQQTGSHPPFFEAAQPNGASNNTTDSTPFKSRSAESINMKFSPSDWHGKFEGNPDYFAPDVPKGTTKGRTSPSRGRSTNRSATERASMQPGRSQPPPPKFTQPLHASQASTQMPPPPPGPPPLNTQSQNGSASAPHSAKFTPEEWQDTFKGSNWVFPAKDSSPRRASVSTNRRPKAVPRKGSTVPNGAPVIDLTGGSNDIKGGRKEQKPQHQAFAEDASNEESDAMDIDSNTPPIEQTKKPPDGSHTAPTSPRQNGSETASKRRSTTAPMSATEQAKSGLDGLPGLRNVEPFAPPANSNGFTEFENLKSSLPFQSKASGSHPLKPVGPQKIVPPDLPVPPTPPEKVTPETYDQYMNGMQYYMVKFREYNSKFINHFSARELQCEDMDPNWMRNIGETTKKSGFDTYVRSLDEDDMLRKYWEVGCDKHKKVMEQCKQVRLRATRGYVDA